MYLKNRMIVPRGGFVFTTAEGKLITGGSFRDLVNKVWTQDSRGLMRHQIEDEIENQICQKTPDLCTQVRGMGDVVALIAQPIASGIDAILGTKVRGCGGCKRRQEALNKALPLP